MALIENVSVAAYTVLAFALTVIAGRAWLHTRSPKIGLLALGFAAFLAKGLALTVGLFTNADWRTDLFIPLVLIDLLVLVLFYGAVLKRSHG